MRIEVTQADIDEGIGHTSATCPVAIAVRRALGCPAFVDCNWIDIPSAGGLMIRTPAVAGNFIFKFDGGNPVLPFSFDLEIPLTATIPL